nr:group II intron maturase-specific domain-containing protein [Streptomyces marianii]
MARRLHRRTTWESTDLARMINPVVRGWANYYGRFYRSALYPLFDRINTCLLRWIQKKYRVGMKQALRRLAEGHARRPRYFAHWTWVAPTG